MTEKTFTTAKGTLHYWTNSIKNNRPALVFLPGLSADHRLFDKQTEYFSDKYDIVTWDAPGHGKSRPFLLDISLQDWAGYLHEILDTEKIENPVLIGQSMGGYLAQSYMQHYPGQAAGFISIDSAPLQYSYLTRAEIWILKHAEPIYRIYPWKLLLKSGSNGTSESRYGRELMHEMMLQYTKDEFCKLAGYGYKILAEAIEAKLPYRIDCPALLIVGDKDKAGSSKRYNKAWSKQTGIRLITIPNAGHNSNTDQPETVNKIIEDFVANN